MMDQKTAAEILQKATAGFQSPEVQKQMQDLRDTFTKAANNLSLAAAEAIADINKAFKK